MKPPILVASILLVCAVGACLCVGCGGGAGTAAEAKTIRVVRNCGGRQAFRQHWLAWKDIFEKQNHGWTLELIDLGDTSAAEYYKARIATNDLPEVIQTFALTGQLADGGQLVPLADGFYDKFGIPPPAPHRGKYFASMGGLQFMGMAVNKKMWADIGVTEPPATWEQFIACLRKLKEKGHRPLVYGGREWSAGMPLQMALHVNLYGAKSSGPSWNKRKDAGQVSYVSDPVARAVMQQMIALLEEFAGKGASSDGYNEEQRDFYSGKGATWIMGCWMGGELEANKVDFDIAYWPFPPLNAGRLSFVSGSHLQTGWAITSTATGEKLAKAQAALDALFDPAGYQLYLNGEAQLSLAKKVPVAGPKSAWPAAQKLFDDMVANVEKYGTVPGFFLALDDMPPPSVGWERAMQEILNGTRDLDKLLKMLDDEWANGRKGE